MEKRILYAALLVLFTIGVGVAIYFVFFRGPVVPPLPEPEEKITPTIPGLPTVAPGVPTAVPTVPPEEIVLPKIAQGGATETTELTEAMVRGAALAADGQSMAYYDTDDGKFYKVDSEGRAQKLSDQKFMGVETVNWSPQTDKAILEFPDGANVLFDFNKGEQITLPKHWEDFSFSPQGDQIAAKSIGLNPDNRWLVVSNADGSRAEAITALGENADKVIVSWSPNDQAVAFSKTGRSRGFDTSEVYLVGKHQENFKSLIVEGRDFRPLWNTEGSRVLYSVYNSSDGYRPKLWIVDGQGDAIGGNRHSLGLNTWADKCTFADASTAYCAVPTSLPEGYGLQPALAESIPDQIYKIDVSTGAKSLLGMPGEGASVKNMRVSSDGRFLFYTDNRTGMLRQMQLR